jgi:hypothetical protein
MFCQHEGMQHTSPYAQGVLLDHIMKKERIKDFPWRSGQLSFTHTPPVYGYIRVYTYIRHKLQGPFALLPIPTHDWSALHACFRAKWPQERLLHRARLAGLQMQDKFLKEYDMEFGPCKAGDDHVWTCEYHLPESSPEQITEYVRTFSSLSTIMVNQLLPRASFLLSVVLDMCFQLPSTE